MANTGFIIGLLIFIVAIFVMVYQLKPDLFKKEEYKQLAPGSPCIVNPQCMTWKCANDICQDENFCETDEHCPENFYSSCNTTTNTCQYEDQVCEGETNQRDDKCNYPFSYCKYISGVKKCKKVDYCENDTHCAVYTQTRVCNTQTNECESVD